jgi:hypothetical protein
MTRGISDTTPIPSSDDELDKEGPSNAEVLAYLDDLSDFVREIDIRLSTIEKFVIKQIDPEDSAKPKHTPKNFLTGKY